MIEDKDESLIFHLEALRLVLIKSLLSLGLLFLPSFLVSPWCMEFLIDVILRDKDVTLNYFAPLEVFILQIKIALVLDIMLCFPYITKQIWNFILPALFKEERDFLRRLIISSSVLFISGIVFCLVFILPPVINFGLSFADDNIKAVLGVSNIVSMSLWLSVVFGIMFQFPLITCAVIRSGIVSCSSVKNKRPYVFVGILIVSALLTPPDVVSQLLLAIPTYLLFELGLLLGTKKQK